MADVFDKATRSRIMRAIRSRDTKPEVRLREALVWLRRLQGYESNLLEFSFGASLPGKPDIAFGDRKLAVFVHGCFWHCCPRHFKPPKSRRAFWRRHFEGNVRRDRRVRRRLRALGWRTMVVWEHEDPATAAARVDRRLREAR